jgi:DNA-binding response OmpR family regulator
MDQTILIIDDDNDLLQLASMIFKKAGAQVITANDGLEGISKFFAHQPDLVILDVIMPGSSGFDICMRIRQVSNTPVIMLTALNQEREMLQGLAVGADDFLSKPFNPEILVARATTVLRRTQRVKGGSASSGRNGYNGARDQGSVSNSSSAAFSYNDGYLSIDIERHEVLVHGNRVKLTPVEFRLLVYLARNGGKLLTFDRILSTVWGNEYRGNIDYVHVYISHLRRKIEGDANSSRYILTVHGEGYMFEKQELIYRT